MLLPWLPQKERSVKNELVRHLPDDGKRENSFWAFISFLYIITTNDKGCNFSCSSWLISIPPQWNYTSIILQSMQVEYIYIYNINTFSSSRFKLHTAKEQKYTSKFSFLRPKKKPSRSSGKKNRTWRWHTKTICHITDIFFLLPFFAFYMYELGAGCDDARI